MSIGVKSVYRTVFSKAPRIGDKLSLPTLTGMAEFTVTQLQGDKGVVECGGLMGYIKREDGQWSFNHCVIHKDVNVPVVLTDGGGMKPYPSNIGFSKMYK